MNREEKIAERCGQIPPKYRKLYERACRRGNLRAAVSAQCLKCSGWVADEVRNCTDVACPLYAHRQLNGECCGSLSPSNGRFIKPESKKSKISRGFPLLTAKAGVCCED